MIQGLADFSAAIANLVANASSLVGAVRIGPNRHITGLHWRNDTIMTVDQALPVQDNYSVILASGSLVAGRRGPRDPASNLALVKDEVGGWAGGRWVATVAVSVPLTPPVLVNTAVSGQNPDPDSDP